MKLLGTLFLLFALALLNACDDTGGGTSTAACDADVDKERCRGAVTRQRCATETALWETLETCEGDQVCVESNPIIDSWSGGIPDGLSDEEIAPIESLPMSTSCQ